MHLTIPSQPSCARAWLAASHAIQTSREAYNVVVDVTDPTAVDERDDAVINLVDSFLRSKNEQPIATVANTIFPQSIYARFGAPEFYEEYLKVFDQFRRTKRWGRYFERMTRHRTADGKLYNPLRELIEKLRRQQLKGPRYKAAHELTVYDPLLDRRQHYGNLPCLSFLSFKAHPERGLALTAIYRNHMYVSKLLGNLIGLGRLQAFVAKEAGMPVAWLTCLSTHAELDVAGGTIADVRTLLAQATTRFA